MRRWHDWAFLVGGTVAVVCAVILVSAHDGPRIRIVEWTTMRARSTSATSLVVEYAACGDFDILEVLLDESASAVAVSLRINDDTRGCGGEGGGLEAPASETRTVVLAAEIGTRDVLNGPTELSMCRYTWEDGSLHWEDSVKTRQGDCT